MRNSLSNLLVVAVVFAFATGIPSSGNSASYKKMSEKECRKEVGKFIKKRGLSSKENYGITRRYCARGDYKGAINAIEKAK